MFIKLILCHRETIQKRCVDDKYPDWKFLTEDLITKYTLIVSKRLEKENNRIRKKDLITI